MKKLFTLLLILPFAWSCGNNNMATDEMATEEETIITGPDQPLEIPPGDLNADSNVAIASNFCSNESKLKMLSTSLLSAYAVKGNGSDLNYCGGTSELSDNGNEFGITLTDYCVDFRGQQLIMNGTIDGVVDSGANFFSSIIPDLTISGDNVDLSISGSTKYGRADDMFLNIAVTDNTSGKQLVLQEVNIKKGEFDLGFFSFGDVGPYEFKFINHFNADLTEGMLFIYGMGEELLILTAENGIVTVVFKQDKRDPGTLLDVASCNG